jgi:hypothetical protein
MPKRQYYSREPLTFPREVLVCRSSVRSRSSDSVTQLDMDVFRSLDQLLDELCLNLPHVGGRALWSRRSPLVTQTLVHVAVIRLHAQFVHISNASRSKSIAAAKSVVAIIRTSNMVEWNHLDSVLGVRVHITPSVAHFANHIRRSSGLLLHRFLSASWLRCTSMGLPKNTTTISCPVSILSYPQ